MATRTSTNGDDRLMQYFDEELSSEEMEVMRDELEGDADLAARFAPIAEQLAANESKINEELIGAQGQSMDIGGYYRPNAELAAKAMRPSATLNEILDGVAAATA